MAAAYGAAGEGKARRVAALISENATILQYYDPAGKGEFPALVLEDVAAACEA